MGKIIDKSDFIEMWNKLFQCPCQEKHSNNIKIVETQREGEGEIFLKFPMMNPSQQFILQCDLTQGFSVSYLKTSKKPDGLVLFVDLEEKVLRIYIIELKANITNKLESANKQIEALFYFIQSLSLEKCFDVSYYCIIGYRKCNRQNMVLRMSHISRNSFIVHLYKGFLDSCENKRGNMPIQRPFCTYTVCDLFSVKFNETLEIDI